MPGARRYTGQLRGQNQRTPRELSLAARPGIELAKSPPREMRHSRRRCLPKPVAGVEWAGAAAVEDTELKSWYDEPVLLFRKAGMGATLPWLYVYLQKKRRVAKDMCRGTN